MFKPGQLAAVERTNQLLVQKLGQNGKIPTRGTEFAAGYDLYSAEKITLKAKTRQAVSTEIAILVPAGTYRRMAPRSGLALKHSINIGAGVVDEDYRGPIKVILINYSKDDFVVNKDLHRQLLPQVRFLKYFLDTNYSFRVLALRPGLQEYGIRPHSRTYYCLLFSFYHMFIIFVISY